MENENDKIASENTNEQPKPTDDVQMDIETVVPSAHQAEVTPGNAEAPAEVKDDQPAEESKEGEKVTEGEEGDDQPAATADESETEKEPSTEETTPKEDEKTNDEEGTDDEDAAESNGEHNGIETVTP